MRIHETELSGAFLIEPERHHDERGYFARTYCRETFAEHGMTCDWVQCNVSFNRTAGTLRGLHYQDEPFPETKLVRCVAGAVWDVIVDLRPESPTYSRWFAVELTAESGRAVVIPPGFAHGFQTLMDNAELHYQMSEPYRPELARGLRWDDPTVAIAWPKCDRRIISPRDAALPYWDALCLRAS